MPDEIIGSEGNTPQNENVRAGEQNIPSQNSIDLNQYTQEVSPTGVITAVNNGLSIPENQNNQLIIDSKGTVEEVSPIEPKQSEVSSQNEVDLNKFEERIFPHTETLSGQPLGSTVPSFTVATEKKPQPDINLLHEEALRVNRERNIGFKEPLSDEGAQALKNIDAIYEDTLRKKEENTPPTPPTPEPTEENRLAELNKTLEETNNILKTTDLNIQTLLRQGIENFSREQMIEYIGLIQKQSELTTKTYEIQQEKNRIAFEKAIKMLQGTEPTPPTPEPTPPTPEPTPPTPKPTPVTVSDTDKVKELEDQLRQLRGENTPEQQSAALGRELAVLEEKLASVGLTDAEKVRSQSNSIKYEPRTEKTLIELEEMDRKQKRKEFWANRLGEASAVLIGGSTGYAIGTLFEGIVGKDFYIGEGKPPETPVGTNTTSSTNTPASASESGSLGSNTQSGQASAPNSTMPDATNIGTGSENWLTGETFNASELGWDYNEMGWLGDRVHLTELGGQNGIMQGEFFQELSRLVPREKLVGQASGNIVNQFLRQAYGGLDPAVAAQKAAEALLSR